MDQLHIGGKLFVCPASVIQCHFPRTDQRRSLYRGPAPYDAGGMGTGMERFSSCPVRVWSSAPVQSDPEHRKEKVCFPVKKEAHLCLRGRGL